MYVIGLNFVNFFQIQCTSFSLYIYISLSLFPREGFYVGVDDDETTGDGGGGGSSGISVIFPVGG